MEHIYPAFERGRIMKKELLWALRDYSYAALQLRYQDYPDGIISGCRVRVNDRQHLLCIGPGMVKCGGFIFLLTGEEQVPYAPTGEYAALKFRLEGKEELPDYTLYRSAFLLDGSLERAQNEIEVCRFRLKEGAALRTEYKDFYDIQTEYDTVNLADATWSSAGGNTLSREITDCFARKVLECSHAQEGDIRFAYMLLQDREAVNCEVLTDYIARRGRGRAADSSMDGSMEAAFRELEGILEDIRSGADSRKSKGPGTADKMIIWD